MQSTWADPRPPIQLDGFSAPEMHFSADLRSPTSRLEASSRASPYSYGVTDTRRATSPVSPTPQFTNISKWACDLCSFHNEMAQTKCDICEGARTGRETIVTEEATQKSSPSPNQWFDSDVAGTPQKDVAGQTNRDGSNWFCQWCSFCNTPTADKCDICLKPRNSESNFEVASQSVNHNLSPRQNESPSVNKSVTPLRSQEQPGWGCSWCGSINDSASRMCGTCRLERSKGQSPSSVPNFARAESKDILAMLDPLYTPPVEPPVKTRQAESYSFNMQEKTKKDDAHQWVCAHCSLLYPSSIASCSRCLQRQNSQPEVNIHDPCALAPP